MDFSQRRFRDFQGTPTLPFYMTYPGYMGTRSEQELLNDLDYLQRSYPREVLKYQQRIIEILDRMDYDGSMIYDEYPDISSLQRMAESVTQILLRESGEQWSEEPDDKDKEKAMLLQDIIQILIGNEIYKRRRRRNVYMGYDTMRQDMNREGMKINWMN